MRDDVRRTTKKHFWGLHHLNIMQSEFQIEAVTTQPLSGVNALVVCIILERTFFFRLDDQKTRASHLKRQTRGEEAHVFEGTEAARGQSLEGEPRSSG